MIYSIELVTTCPQLGSKRITADGIRCENLCAELSASMITDGCAFVGDSYSKELITDEDDKSRHSLVELKKGM